MKNIVTILWTGGWDSTFRLLCLAENEDISIQPVYVIDENRKSKEYELDAMNKILTMIRMGGGIVYSKRRLETLRPIL